MSELLPSDKTTAARGDVISSGEAEVGLSKRGGTRSLREQQLVAVIKSISCEDEKALAALYDATNRLLYGLVLRILGEANAAEEVLLDVYKQVWRKAASYDETRGAPLSWLMTIARSRALDRLRSERKERQRVDSLAIAHNKIATHSDVERDAAFAELRQVMGKALESLPPEQRTVIDLAYYGGLSQSEIAARLNQPLGTIKTRTRLALIKLREALKGFHKEIG